MRGRKGNKPEGNNKKWQPGDLVLHESDPKIHGMLMEVLQVQGDRARIIYLDGRERYRASFAQGETGVLGVWYPLDKLQDPALFLRTEEFQQTLRERARWRRRGSTGS